MNAGRMVTAMALAMVLAHAAAGGDGPAAVGGDETRAMRIFETSPAIFVENHGQWDSKVRYAFNGSGVNVLFTDAGPVFRLFSDEEGAPAAATVTARFVAASESVPEGVEPSEAYANFHVGSDPSRWKYGVPSYRKVRYTGIYDGIDLECRGRRSGLKYEFRVEPGADWRKIAVRYAGIDGLSIDSGGALHVETALGEMVDDAPVAYQDTPGGRREVAARFVLADERTYAFEITGEYDPSLPLVIDPEIEWSRFVGGDSTDRAYAIAADALRSVYITGNTSCSDWTGEGYDTTVSDGTIGFVTRISAAGRVEWTTFFGGNKPTSGHSIVLDYAGSILVAGYTYDGSWAYGCGSTFGGGLRDGFLMKLSPTGRHLWSRYIGSGGIDVVLDIATDATGHVCMTGYTETVDWLDDGIGGWADVSVFGFVLKVDPRGSVLWSRYLGADPPAVHGPHGNAIDVDADGNIYVGAESTDVGWVEGGYDTTFNGLQDGLLVKLAPAGEHVWSTYVGGAGRDKAYALHVNSGRDIYIAGTTRLGGWAEGGYDAVAEGYGEGFAARLTPDGAHVWSTYLGGVNEDRAWGITVDDEGDVYVVGKTESPGWTRGGFDVTLDGPVDGFIVKLNPQGRHLWSSYMGGDGGGGATDDAAADCGVDAAGNVYVVGTTKTRSWLGYREVMGNTYDGFILKIAADSPLPQMLPDAAVGEAYHAALPGTVDVPPGHWSLASGGLPAGLSLDGSSGEITGAAAESGVHTFMLDLSDSGDPPVSVRKAFSIRVASCPPTRMLVRRLSVYRNPRRPNFDRFILQAYINLTDLSVDWSAVPVTVRVGPYEETLPAGSFVTRNGWVWFYRAPRGFSSGIRYAMVNLRSRLVTVNASRLDLSAMGDTVEAILAAGDFYGSCTLTPRAGRIFTLGGLGELHEDAFLVERTFFTMNPRFSGRDRMSLFATIDAASPPDLTTEELTISVGGLSWTFPAGSFRQLGRRRVYIYRGGRGEEIRSVLVDFERGKLRLIGARMNLAGMDERIDVSFSAGELFLVTSIELTRRGNRLMY